MTTEAPRPHPGVYFPPPLTFVAGFLLALALERWVVSLRLDERWRPVLTPAGWLLIALGVGLMAWAVLTFTRARTTVLPYRPASQVVSSGPFRFSRNPIYLADTLIYAGMSLLTRMAWPLVVLPFVLVALYALVIKREERYLGEAFGTEYAEYRRRVRRWV